MLTLDNGLFLVTFFAALSCGVMAGLFFTFSNFVMTALADIKPESGIPAMQAINRKIVNPLFLIVFLGAALASLLLAVFAVLYWAKPGSLSLLAGSLLYLVGGLGVTIAFNIPRNDALEKIDGSLPHSADVWRSYLRSWTRWNHVRTAATVAATALLVHAFSQLAGTLG